MTQQVEIVEECEEEVVVETERKMIVEEVENGHGGDIVYPDGINPGDAPPAAPPGSMPPVMDQGPPLYPPMQMG